MLKIPGKLPSRAQSTVVLKNIIYIYIYIAKTYICTSGTPQRIHIYIYILLRSHFGSNAACTTVLACEHRTWWLHGSRRGGSRHRHGHPCRRAAYRRGSLSSRRIGLPAKSGPGLHRTSSGRPPGPGCLHRRSVRLRRTCGRRAPWVSTRRTTGECRRPCRRMKCGNLEKGTIGSKQARHGPPLRNQRWR
jgi:hypothetical protein